MNQLKSEYLTTNNTPLELFHTEQALPENQNTKRSLTMSTFELLSFSPRTFQSTAIEYLNHLF